MECFCKVKTPDFTLYLITDRALARGGNLQTTVREALQGGVKAVQLREKDLSSRELYMLAAELRELTSHFGAKLFINDRADIARAVDADGVHAGKLSLPLPQIRTLLGPSRLIGYSAHTIEEAFLAEAAGADFLTFGPVYFTSSKAVYGPPVGIEKLRAACSALSIPVYALGGITVENIPEILNTGATGIALISAIMATPAPAAAATTLLQIIDQHAICSGSHT